MKTVQVHLIIWTTLICANYQGYCLTLAIEKLQNFERASWIKITHVQMCLYANFELFVTIATLHHLFSFFKIPIAHEHCQETRNF